MGEDDNTAEEGSRKKTSEKLKQPSHNKGKEGETEIPQDPEIAASGDEVDAGSNMVNVVTLDEAGREERGIDQSAILLPAISVAG